MIKKCKTAILISGSGTNLQAFINAIEENLGKKAIKNFSDLVCFIISVIEI